MRIRVDIDLTALGVNKIIWRFIAADFLLFGGWGIVNPIFSIFVIDRIPGATLTTVGAVAALYWIVKSLIQIPVAQHLDRIEGERDDFHTLILSLVLAGCSLFLFLVVKTTFSLYAVVFLQAIAFGLYVPSWSALFSRHLEQKHYSFDWALDSTSVGIAAGVTGFLGGIAAEFLGYEVVFVAAGALVFASIFVLLAVPSFIFPKQVSPKPVIQDHDPVNVHK